MAFLSVLSFLYFELRGWSASAIWGKWRWERILYLVLLPASVSFLFGNLHCCKTVLSKEFLGAVNQMWKCQLKFVVNKVLKN